MIAFGCEDKNRSPIIEDRICPKCGRDIEVFLLGGRIMEDAVKGSELAGGRVYCERGQ